MIKTFDPKDYIYFSTVQHTGTWFMLRFLLGHPDVGAYIPNFQFVPALTGGKNCRSFFGDKEVITPVPEELAEPGKITIVHEHSAGPQRHAWSWLNLHHAALMLIRDPLRVMISWKFSLPKYPPHQLVVVWKDLAIWLPKFEELHELVIFPVDQLALESVEVRKEYLSAVLKGFRLKPSDHVNEVAEQYDSVGGGGTKESYSTIAKKAYFNRDVKFFENDMPEAFQALRDEEKVMRPFFERWYKDLLWWS